MRLLVAIFLWATVGNIHAQENFRRIDSEQWSRAVDGLDYSKDLKAAEKPRPFRLPDGKKWTDATAFWGQVLQYAAILLLLMLIGFGIYKMLNVPRNKQIASDGVVITVENLEAYLHETDLEKFLREALASGNYALAVRVYYLQTIKDLSAKDWIKWSREKTNREYLREFSRNPRAETFRQLTRIFEQAWYGNRQLSLEQFQEIQPLYENFLNSLKTP